MFRILRTWDMLYVMRSWCVLLVFFTFALWQVPPANGFLFHDGHEDGPGSFKEIIHRVVRASRENLRPLKTFRVDVHPRGGYWYEVAVLLPGAKICRIYEHPQLVYRCEWHTPTKGTVSSVYTSVVKNVQDALGSTEWTSHSSTNGRDATRFEPVNPRRNPLIEVRVAGPKANPIVEVSLFKVDRWDESA